MCVIMLDLIKLIDLQRQTDWPCIYNSYIYFLMVLAN